MKATELKLDNVIAVNVGVMNPEMLVRILGIDGDVAVGADLDTGAVVLTTNNSDFRSGNGSPIGSWNKLGEHYAASLIFTKRDLA